MEKRPYSQSTAKPSRTAGRSASAKSRKSCTTSSTVLFVLLFVLPLFLNLLLLLLHVLLFFLHVFLLLLQVFLCFLYVLLFFLHVLLLLLGFVTPATAQDQRQCQKNYPRKYLQACGQLYCDRSISFPAAVSRGHKALAQNIGPPVRSDYEACVPRGAVFAFVDTRFGSVTRPLRSAGIAGPTPTRWYRAACW